MTKPDLFDAILPHLIAAVPEPFSPTEAVAKQVLAAAAKWVELLHSERDRDKTLQLFTLG
jgi:hypothetical protein